jgi:prevent-host-death family protein
MNQVSLEEARSKLARIVKQAARGEDCIITKAGKPLVKIVAIKPHVLKTRRIGFMLGEFTTPDDFDRLAEAEIAELFSASA